MGELAKRADVTLRTLSTYENMGVSEDDNVNVTTLSAFANVLRYPVEFFFKEAVEPLNDQQVSFRAMSNLTAAKRNGALAIGSIGYDLNSWIESKFTLPALDLLSFVADQAADPESAAIALRDYWKLGDLSIKNVVHLLESKGIRVYSLSENCREVDAFSFWMDQKPFIFLNTMKSFERSRFDAAHELGHLVLHKHGECFGRQAEQEADAFASCFLMPRSTVLASVPKQPTLSTLISLKSRWKVSLAALVRRTFDLGLSSEWHYRQLNIQLTRLGYRTSEPNGMEKREASLVAEKMCENFRREGFKRSAIVKETCIPLDEISSLLFQNPFFSTTVVSSNSAAHIAEVSGRRSSVDLKIV